MINIIYKFGRLKMKDDISIKEFCFDYTNPEKIKINEMVKKYGISRSYITTKAKKYNLPLRKPRKNWV
jgi:hypothetical protein